MVSLSQRLSRSDALTSACLHVHVGRALLFSFPCRSQSCHDISRIGSSQKVIRTDLHAYTVHFPNSMGILNHIQLMMGELQCEPENFTGWIIFMSIFNDIVAADFRRKRSSGIPLYQCFGERRFEKQRKWKEVNTLQWQHQKH